MQGNDSSQPAVPIRNAVSPLTNGGYHDDCEKDGNTATNVSVVSDAEQALARRGEEAWQQESQANCRPTFRNQLVVMATGWLELWGHYSPTVTKKVKWLFLALYFVYFGFAMACSVGDEGGLRLLVITAITCLVFGYKQVCKTQLVTKFRPIYSSRISNWITQHHRLALGSVYLSGSIFIGAVTIEAACRHPYNLVSACGMASLIGLCSLFSVAPSKINWHIVFMGTLLQFFFATIVLRVGAGYELLVWLGDRVIEFQRNSFAGAEFVFGKNFRDHFFAISVSCNVTFFCASISVLYYYGIAQAVIRKIAQILQFIVGTSPTESVVASANVILSMTESTIAVGPLMSQLTQSELHSILTSGFATMSGSLLGVYSQFGVSASHLLSASLMSAPAALVASKILYPETQPIRVTVEFVRALPKPDHSNVIHAFASGAESAIPIVSSLLMNLVAFVSTLRFINSTLQWFGDRICLPQPLSFELIASYIFWPLSMLMGADISDCRKVAELVGVKTFLNEFIAYMKLSEMINNRKVLDSYNGTIVPIFDDLFLPDLNQTLIGGSISVCLYLMF